ncbi:TPA: cysteine desulfurase, partial [Streptococcus equi subsp. equi]|nr:cysteine desulfurase [Streptococcus equi subsp. equi]
MAFEKEIALKDCKYSYRISPKIKKYTLRDTTFSQTKIGHY